jgi:formate dehydrogenase subunit gamma
LGKGEVDVNWARQHHSLWLEKQVKKGRAQGGAPAPAE